MKMVKRDFLFEESVAKHLEELAESENKSMTLILQEMIEKKYKDIKVKKRVEAFKKIVGSSNGYYKDLTIQEIKAEMDV